MSADLVWANLRTYSLQIALLIAASSAALALFRMRVPRARLLFWHAVLVACVALPLLRPPQRAVVAGNVEVSTAIVAVRPAAQSAGWNISAPQAVLFALAAGIVARLVWLCVGLWKLRRYRLHSSPGLSGYPADIRFSTSVGSPVTFGLRKPVILLPENFPELEPSMQQAVLCHELLHVERRDWLFTVAEEVIRAIFWFHPAIWWLLGEIGLAREQEVDRLVVERTKSRESYVDALLAIAGVTPRLDLAPAPLFLRKRHLKQRVVSILKEAAMSKTRWISALAAGLVVVAVACWMITVTLPLTAAPQVVNDGSGVTVDVGGAALMHRAPVNYPVSARSKGVQGTVVVQVRMDSSGSVVDAQVLSGPDELRRAALESVLQWHFAREAGTSRQVSITFQAPAGPAPAEMRTGTIPHTIAPAPPGDNLGTLNAIDIVGLSDQQRADLASRIPIHVGDNLTRDVLQKVQAEVRGFDEHLSVGVRTKGDPKSATMTITAPGNPVRVLSSSESNPLPAGPGLIKVGGKVQQMKLIQTVRPVYPELAKQARISGLVRLEAVIGKDGSVLSLKAEPGGHPLLVPAAMEAVKQWKYETTLLNGEPVEVITTIDVNFTLAE